MTNKLEENKPRRVPVSGLRDILNVMGKDPEFVYRFVEDVDENGTKIQAYIRGGYELTQVGKNSNVIVGEEAVYKSKRKEGGSIVRYPSGSNGKSLYLMQIKKEWHEEDQAAKMEHIDEVESLIKGKKTSEDNELGQYGKVTIEDGLAKSQ